MNKVQEIAEMRSVIERLYFSDYLYIKYNHYYNDRALIFQIEAAIDAKVLWALQAGVTLEELKESLEDSINKKKKWQEEEDKRKEEEIKKKVEKMKTCSHEYLKRKIGFLRFRLDRDCHKCGHSRG